MTRKARDLSQEAFILTRYQQFQALPPEERERVQQNHERWQRLSPDERRQLRERLRPMTPEQRRERFRQLRPSPPAGGPEK